MSKNDEGTSDTPEPRVMTDEEKMAAFRVADREMESVALHRMALARAVTAENQMEASASDRERAKIALEIRKLERDNFVKQIENAGQHGRLLLQIKCQVIRQSKLIAGILGVIAGHLNLDPKTIRQTILTDTAWPGGDDETDPDSGPPS